MSLPETDRYSYSKIELESRVAMMFGGRIAEELTFGAENVTTGAGNDIKQATELARSMVTEYGFSPKLGPLKYTENEEEIFLGRSVTQHKNVSDGTAQLIDEEIRRLVEEGEALARKILEEHRDDLVTLAKGLLEYETLNGKEVAALLRGETIVRPDESETPEKDIGRKSSVPASGSKGREHPGGLEPEPQTSS
jgi:cell division protease FtsH